MAIWKEIKNYIKENYDNCEEEPGMIKTVISLAGGRSQIVILGLTETEDGEDWLMILSPIGLLKKLDLDEVLLYSSKFVCGGVVAIEDIVYYRHGTLIDDLSTDELIQPMSIIASAADQMEKKFMGGDRV